MGLHPGWRGLKGVELEFTSRLKGILFVHSNGYIGGHMTRDGVIAMARKSLIFPSGHHDKYVHSRIQIKVSHFLNTMKS